MKSVRPVIVAEMKGFGLARIGLAVMVGILVSGCIASRVEESGGPSAVTIQNTSVTRIFDASRQVFPEYGYRLSRARFPDSIAFDRPAGRFGELLFGSHMRETAFRVTLEVRPIPGTRDFRVTPRVSRVSGNGTAAFERETDMLRVWRTQLRPILREIQRRAEG